MARSLANIIYKGIAASPAARPAASGSLYQSILRFSTTVPNDPDTHEDFRPTSKIEKSDLSLKDIVEQVRGCLQKLILPPSNDYCNTCLIWTSQHYCNTPKILTKRRQGKPCDDIYMKGVPDFLRCGFSALAVRVLNEYRVPLSSRNILEDQELKNAVKSFSHWPTFPQIFINGEFVGGSDIILNMHQNGELKQKLKDVAGKPQ